MEKSHTIFKYKPINFILKFDKTSRFYAEVIIFNTQKDLWRHYGHKARAYCWSYNDKYKGKPDYCVGQIGFSKTFMGYQIVVHELTHLAFRWARRKRLSWELPKTGRKVAEGEEMIAHCLDRLMVRFYNHKKIKDFSGKKTYNE